MRKTGEKIKDIALTDDEKKLLNKGFYDVSDNYGWAHFAHKNITPTTDELLNLRTFIANSINNSLILSIYRKLKTELVNTTT